MIKKLEEVVEYGISFLEKENKIDENMAISRPPNHREIMDKINEIIDYLNDKEKIDE